MKRRTKTSGTHLRSALLVSLLMGCSGCDNLFGDSNGENDCEAQVDVLDAFLREAALAEPRQSAPDVHLPALTTGDTISVEAATPILVIDEEEVRLAGRGVGGGANLPEIAATLGRDLQSLARAHRLTHGDDALWPGAIAVWADSQLPVEHLSRVLREAPESARFFILVREASEADPGLPASLTEALAQAENRSETRQAFGEAWTEASSGCAGLGSTLVFRPSLSPQGTSPSVGPMLSALHRCDCTEIQPSLLRPIARGALTPPSGRVRALGHVLRFGIATDSVETLDLPEGATMEQLATDLSGRSPTDTGLWINAR